MNPMKAMSDRKWLILQGTVHDDQTCLICNKQKILSASTRAISRSSQCSTTGVTKAVVCVILLWNDAYKKVAHVAVGRFLSRYLSVPLPYVSCHITINIIC